MMTCRFMLCVAWCGRSVNERRGHRRTELYIFTSVSSKTSSVFHIFLSTHDAPVDGDKICAHSSLLVFEQNDPTKL